jgi:hypothetical protein
VGVTSLSDIPGIHDTSSEHSEIGGDLPDLSAASLEEEHATWSMYLNIPPGLVTAHDALQNAAVACERASSSGNASAENDAILELLAAVRDRPELVGELIGSLVGSLFEGS